MKIKELSDLDLIKAIIKVDQEIVKLLTQPNLDSYPGAIMGLGDYYVERFILMNELLLRKNMEKK